MNSPSSNRKSKKNAKKGPHKKKYTPATLKKAGSLLSVSDDIWVNAASLCCLTQRLTLAQGNLLERRRLLEDIGRMVAP